MKTFARYTTFREGELEATLHGLDPKGHHRQLSGMNTGRSKSGIIKSHVCTVTYPDATTGTCRYLRGGPTWHIFRYEHTSSRSGKTATLPVQNETQRIGNSLAAIEEHAQKLADKAFSEAMERERRDYFRRVVPPPPYKMAHAGKQPTEQPQMKAKEAKQASGRYALCIRVGRSLLPTGDSLETMDEAVEAWQSGNDVSRVIGCCCRWKRRWEEPSYNPLHGDKRYPPPFPCPDRESVVETAIRDAQVPTQAVPRLTTPATTAATTATPPQWAAVDEVAPLPGEADMPPNEEEYDEYDESPDGFWEGDDDE